MILGNDTDFNVGRLEIGRQDVRQRRYGQLDDFIMAVVLFLLVFLLQIRGRLRLFHSDSSGTIATIISFK